MSIPTAHYHPEMLSGLQYLELVGALAFGRAAAIVGAFAV